MKIPSPEKSKTTPPIKRRTQLGILAPESCSSQGRSTGFGIGVRKSLFSAKSKKKASDLNCKYPSKVFLFTSVDRSILSPSLSVTLNRLIQGFSTIGVIVLGSGSGTGNITGSYIDVGVGTGSGYFTGSQIGVVAGTGYFAGSYIGIGAGAGSGYGTTTGVTGGGATYSEIIFAWITEFSTPMYATPFEI